MSRSTATDALAQTGVLSDESLDLVSAGFDATAYASRIGKYSDEELNAAYAAAHTRLRGLLKIRSSGNPDLARISGECQQEIDLMKDEYATRHIEPPFRS